MLSLGGGSTAWHYVTLYFVALVAVIVYVPTGTTNGSLALLNAGGLPPMTGFMIKLRALARLDTP